jgi:hypothetical protein
MRCPGCGQRFDGGTNFCEACGTRLVADGQPVVGASDAAVPPGKTRRGWKLAGLAVAVAVVLAALGVGGYLAYRRFAAPRTPEQQAQTSAASDLELFKTRDYKTHYAALAASDQKQVDEAEWVRRCQEVEKAFGAVQSYEVVASRFLDTSETIVAVDLDIQFSNQKAPVRSTVFYVKDGGTWRQSMLWGRDVEIGGP